MEEWYEIDAADLPDSPSLVIYRDRVRKNIELLVNMIDAVDRLRPHVKTCKSVDAVMMMLAAGIKKFKCATIAEAEMLATASARDILLAYQPVGPKFLRLIELMRKFPGSKFCRAKEVRLRVSAPMLREGMAARLICRGSLCPSK